MSRTTVPVESEVAKEISAVAKARGFSVLRLVSDSLKLSVELLRRGITPTRAVEMFRLLEKVLAFDVVPVPLPFIELLARKWNTCEDSDAERFLREVGEKFGRVLTSEFRTFGEFMQIAAQFFSFLPVARMNFSKTDNMWRIVFVSSGEMSVKCLGYFAEEVIKQFGCTPRVKYSGNIVVTEVVC